MVGQSTIFTGSGNAGLWTVGSGVPVSGDDLGTWAVVPMASRPMARIAGYSATRPPAYHAVL